MAITYKDSSGVTRKVESVVFNGVAIKKLQYGSGNGPKRIVWCKPYTFLMQQGVGVKTVEVRRTASQEPSASIGVLSDGSTIYRGDTLSVSAIAQDGYTLNAYNRTYSVTDNLAINISATLNYYTLSYSLGTGVASIKVTRTSSPIQNATTGELSSGDRIYYGDKLSVTATASTGYTLSGYTSSYTVSSDINISITSNVQSFTLHKSQGTGVASVVVTRTASQYKGAALGNLVDNSVIYYGDKLSVSASSMYGYTLNAYTNSYTVGGNVTVNVTARVMNYTLRITQDSGISSVSVTRTSSPKQGAATGRLSSGSTIYHGDTLTVSVTAHSGYEPNAYTASYTVSGNIDINITSRKLLSMSAPGISGQMTHDSYSNACYLTLYINNPNNFTVTADIEVNSCASGALVYNGTISLSPNENRTYHVGEMYTNEVDAIVTLSRAGYLSSRNSERFKYSFNNSSSSSGSGSGSTSSGNS